MGGMDGAKLVIVGKESLRFSASSRMDTLPEGVVHLTSVNDDELACLYSGARGLLYPSLYEGFGLPILEAMACGRAVACSQLTAMPEVANAAGILFDPSSKEEITRAMLDVLRDAELRARLERLGVHRAAAFSWERSAARTLQVYYEVAGQHRRRDTIVAARVS
jgi:glycosyltransferase involved in cell wall biosynthesis